MAVTLIALGAALTLVTILDKIRALRAHADRQADALEAINHAIERVAVALETR
jgi:hypothetical protein